MEKIVVQKINESVYELLLANIKNGRWKSGDKLPSESELCAFLGVSRVSVRSALQRLKGMGLIEVKQGKGAFVCGAEASFDFTSFMKQLTLTERELIEINAVRRMLENEAIRMLMQKNKEYDLSQFEHAYSQMKIAAEKCDYEEFTKHDYMFHVSLMMATENRYLIQMVRVLQNDLFVFLRESNKFMLRDEDDPVKTREYFQNAMSIHAKIYEAIMLGDLELAIEISKSHAALNEARFGWYFTNKN